MTNEVGQPGIVECWRAARSVRRAECGREVNRWLRPRAELALMTRARLPMTLLILLAAQENRLLRESPDAFAIVEPPGSRRRAPDGAPRAARMLRILDPYWPLLSPFGVPGGVPFYCALRLAVHYGWLSEPSLAYPVVVAFLGLSFILAVGVTINVFRAGMRNFLPRSAAAYRAKLATGDIRNQQWTMLLCHQHDSQQAMRVVAAVLADRRTGGRLVVLQEGITTCAVRAAIADSPYVRHRSTEPSLLLMSVEPSGAMPLPSIPAGFWRPGQWAALAMLVTFTATWTAFWALIVANVERSTCAGTSCGDRPVTYRDALYWLVTRLVTGGDPDGWGATTATTRLIAIVASVAHDLVIVGVVLGVVTTLILPRFMPPPDADEAAPASSDPSNERVRMNTAVPVAQRRPAQAAVTAAGVALVCGVAVGAYLTGRCRGARHRVSGDQTGTRGCR